MAGKKSFIQSYDASSSKALNTAVDYDTEDSGYKWVQILRGEIQGIAQMGGIDRVHHIKQLEK